MCCFEQDVHGVMPGEQESDSEDSSMENLGDVTQFGLTGALAQMANMTFMAGAPGICFYLKPIIFILNNIINILFHVSTLYGWGLNLRNKPFF